MPRSPKNRDRVEDKAEVDERQDRGVRDEGVVGDDPDDRAERAEDDQALDSDPGQRQRPGDRSAEETAERVRELNERIIEASNRGGHVYLDAYERTLKSIADFEERVAGASQVEWISAVANAQANFTREIAEAYTQAGREFLK